MWCFRELLSDSAAFGPASISLGKETMFAGRCELEKEEEGSWEAVSTVIKKQGGGEWGDASFYNKTFDIKYSDTK